MVIFDFDGVMTDNRVWMFEDGREAVACNRADGLGIARLRACGVAMAVLSTEVNPVVAARCKKLGIPCWQGRADKGPALMEILAAASVPPERAAFVGNDVNDLPCLKRVGLPVVVADAHPDARAAAALALRTRGGYGAVREFCDWLVGHLERGRQL